MEKIFLDILNMSLTASFVIIVIIAARLLLKKAPKSISYALWAVVGFRLIFSFNLESVFSLLPFKAEPIPADIALQAIPRINSGIAAIDNAISVLLPAATPAASANPLQIWVGIGSYVWFFGMAAMLIISLVSLVLLKHRLFGARFIAGNIFEAAKLKTPFVIGLFKPKIYLPPGLFGDERRYIILHEQTHIRRYDHIVKMLAFLVLCLHWFNPLVWVAFLLMGADMEMSCDERVIKELGREIKNDYSLSLVRMAAGHKILNGSPLAFGEGTMKQRIKNVLNFKKPSRIIIIATLTLVIILTIGFAVSKTNDIDNYSNYDDSVITPLEQVEQHEELLTSMKNPNNGSVSALPYQGEGLPKLIAQLVDLGKSEDKQNNGSILAWPFQGDGISSNFGYRKSGYHIGLDIAGSLGDVVVAAANGEVILSEWYSNNYGNLVIITHPNGIETWYAHLSAFAVKMGDIVKEGDVIGEVGDTGQTTGPHLHFEVRVDGKTIDPLLLLGDR